jgi:hypothetical protein
VLPRAPNSEDAGAKREDSHRGGALAHWIQRTFQVGLQLTVSRCAATGMNRAETVPSRFRAAAVGCKINSHACLRILTFMKPLRLNCAVWTDGTQRSKRSIRRWRQRLGIVQRQVLSAYRRSDADEKNRGSKAEQPRVVLRLFRRYRLQ